jgi:hypothetical protein
VVGGSGNERPGAASVTVLIDPPLWPAHGRRWSHLVSDTSLGELHAFARGLGIPDRGFEGDHYDLPEERYADAVHAGAVPVGSRELLRRLQGSGLRRPKRRGERVLASSQLAGGVRVDTLESAREPVGPVDAVVLVVHHLADLLVLTDGEGFSLPRAVVPAARRRDEALTQDAALRAASALLGRLLGPVRPPAVPVQLGYLRTVPIGAVPAGAAVVWRWLLDGATRSPEARPPALWRPAVDAVALLPADLAPLLRSHAAGAGPDRSNGPSPGA